MALDEELIARSNRSNEEADNSESDASDSDFEGSGGDDKNSAWREEKQKARNGSPEASTGNLRTDKLASLRKQKDKSQGGKEGVGGKLASSALSPARKGISKLLQAAWENLIDSFGFTLGWIDIHYISSYVFGKKLFCDLGEEWVPSVTFKANGEVVDNNLAAKAGNSIGIIEKTGCLFLNLSCLLQFLIILSIIVMIAAALDDPLQAGWALMTEVAKLIAEIFTGK